MNLFSFLCNIILISSCSTLPKSHQVGTRIIGGEDATAAKYKFAAAINVRTATSQLFCGGTLLTNQWVLTAGQCVYNAVSFTIKLGATHLNSSDSSHVILSTGNYVIHPEYDPLTYKNDIGLIRFNMPVAFTQYVQPIEFLATFRLQDYAQGSALGWGQTSDTSAGESNILQEVELVTLSNSECAGIYGDVITDTLFCAAGNNNEGICIGDAGGAFVQHVGRGYYISVGVASFYSGNGCESTDPSGFTRTFEYASWIINITDFRMVNTLF